MNSLPLLLTAIRLQLLLLIALLSFVAIINTIEATGEGENALVNDMNNSDKLSALIHSAVAGDTSTLPQVKELLASLPELVPAIGDAQRQVEQKILDMTIGQNILKREAITRDLDFHERQLRGYPETFFVLLQRDHAASLR